MLFITFKSKKEWKKQIKLIFYLFIKLCLIYFLSVVLLVRHYKKILN